jgi:hypothetical protein
MNRIGVISLTFFTSGLLLAVVWSGVEQNVFASKLAAIDDTTNGNAPGKPRYWNTVPFGVDDWITSVPTNAILATFTYETQTYPALVALQYGLGNVVYAPGSVFTEINNLSFPHNVLHEIFLNSAKWVTNDQIPTQTTVLVTYGHRELVTYSGANGTCCTSNIIRALEDEGYRVEITSDIPMTLTRYAAVIMPGVGWYGTPGYSNTLYWSGDAGHAPTPTEVASLLDFVQNGGGLIASVEAYQGAAWMNPIGMPMSVTFGSISGSPGLQGNRVTDHVILMEHQTFIYLPLVSR